MGDFMKKESKQHFYLSAKARTLSVCEVMQITHEQAFLLFKEMRWGKAHPICLTAKHKIITILFVVADNGGVNAA